MALTFYYILILYVRIISKEEIFLYITCNMYFYIKYFILLVAKKKKNLSLVYQDNCKTVSVVKF